MNRYRVSFMEDISNDSINTSERSTYRIRIEIEDTNILITVNGFILLSPDKAPIFKKMFRKSNIKNDMYHYLKRRMSRVEMLTHPLWIIREVCRINNIE